MRNPIKVMLFVAAALILSASMWQLSKSPPGNEKQNNTITAEPTFEVFAVDASIGNDTGQATSTFFTREQQIRYLTMFETLVMFLAFAILIFSLLNIKLVEPVKEVRFNKLE